MCSRFKVFAFLFLISVSLDAQGKDLQDILASYETELLKAASNENVVEASASIVILARLGSPQYLKARDLLIKRNEIEIKLALIRAIYLIQDDSPTAIHFLQAALTSNSQKLVYGAVPVVRELELKPFDFAPIWNPKEETYLWHVIARSYSTFEEQLANVGKVRPWRDASWNSLNDNTKVILLSRAGTPEAFEILLPILKSQNREEYFLTPAEPVNVSFLESLMKHSSPSVRAYACKSLRNAGNLSCVNAIQKALLSGDAAKYMEMPGGIYEFLPHLSAEAIKAYMESGHDGEIQSGYYELVNRRNQHALKELTKEKFPLVSNEMLRNLKIRTAGFEKNYVQLLTLLHETMEASDLERYSALPNFLDAFSAAPDNIAHEAYLMVHDWFNARYAKGPFNWYSAEGASMDNAALLMGSVARGTDQDELWKTWQGAADPLEEDEILWAILGSQNKRSERVRRILANTNVDIGHLNAVFQNVRAETGPRNFCPEVAPLISELSFDLDYSETQTPLLLNKTLDFAKDLNDLYRNRWDQFMPDFLHTRGIDLKNSTPEESAKYLMENEKKLPKTLRELIVAAPQPSGLAHPWRRRGNAIFLPDSFQTLFFENNNGTLYFKSSQMLPEPDLNAADESWLRKVISENKDKWFSIMVDSINKPELQVVPQVAGEQPLTGYRTPEIRSFVNFPSGALLGSGKEYLPKIRELANSSDLNIRYAALWALWNLARDESAVQTWMNDAQSSDQNLKARALFVLQKIRYEPAKSLFQKTLSDADPAIRQVGLFAVQSFFLYDSLPAVYALVDDTDGNVRDTAIQTLGIVRSAPGRDLLLKLTERNSDVVSDALAHYREPDDVQKIIAAYKATSSDSPGYNNLHATLSRLSLQQFIYASWDNAKLNAWIEWWKKNSKSTPQQWASYWLTDLVSDFLNSTDQNFQIAALQLENHFANFFGDLRNDPAAKITFANAWKFNKDTTVWETFSSEPLYVDKDIDLLMAVDSHRTIKYLLTRYQGQFIYSENYGCRYHDTLVNNAGKDFGNPCIALCELRAKIASDWYDWERTQKSGGAEEKK